MSNQIIRFQNQTIKNFDVFESTSFETMNEFVHVFIISSKFLHEVEEISINETQVIDFVLDVFSQETIVLIVTTTFFETKKQEYRKLKIIEVTALRQNEFARFRARVQFN